MIDKQKRLVTAEAVRRGHPDKLCDQIADAILDAHLSYDPNARVAVEVMATAGSITVAGEVTSRADVNYEKIVLDVIQQIGYKWADLCEDEHDDLDIHIAVHDQSPDIAAAVDGRFPDSDQGAGDQGIMVGYATNETFSMMPRSFVIAQRICRLLDEEAAHTPWLGVDGKAQVSLEYEGDQVSVHTIVVSVQHTSNAPEDKLRELVTQVVYQAVGRADIEALPEWDGTARVDHLFTDYLGALDTPYNRAVARKMMVAAVARVYQPGVKFDSVVVLVGPQGMGKSSFFAKIGGKWFSDSLTIGDMKDKAAPEKLQGYWILELGELAGLKKVDVETVKAFITRQDDKFRHSYGYSVEDHLRQCIIVGSTNTNDGFLRDITGNRRFWPVTCSTDAPHRPWEVEDIVPQLWAEAYHYFKEGEPLYLTTELEAVANQEQVAALESDVREGMISEYLNALLPENWDSMDISERRAFLRGDMLTAGNRVGTVKRTAVSAVEVWAECFGRDPATIKRADTYDIFGMLMKIGGWEKYTGNKNGSIRRPPYGPQRCYIRTGSDTVA